MIEDIVDILKDPLLLDPLDENALSLYIDHKPLYQDTAEIWTWEYANNGNIKPRDISQISQEFKEADRFNFCKIIYSSHLI